MSLVTPNTIPERTGHVAASYKDSILIWGGYKGMPHRQYLYYPADEIWVYCPFVEKWSCKVCSFTDGLSGMFGSTAAVLSDHLYLFGGFCQNPEGSVNTLYCLDLNTFRWSKKNAGGLLPCDVVKSASWAHNEKFYIFGGFGSLSSGTLNTGFQFVFHPTFLLKGWTNQLHEYNPETNEWAIPTTIKEKLPSARAAHAVACYGDRVYLFGGRRNKERLNDLHCLHMGLMTWSGRISCSGPIPEGRSWHSLTAFSEELLLLYGGLSQSKEVLNDCWIFDTVSCLWTRLQLAFIQPRVWHTATLTIFNEVAIFGGCCYNILENRIISEEATDTIIIRIQPKSLFRLCLDELNSYPEIKSEWSLLPISVQAILNTRFWRKFKNC